MIKAQRKKGIELSIMVLIILIGLNLLIIYNVEEVKADGLPDFNAEATALLIYNEGQQNQFYKVYWKVTNMGQGSYTGYLNLEIGVFNDGNDAWASENNQIQIYCINLGYLGVKMGSENINTEVTYYCGRIFADYFTSESDTDGIIPEENGNEYLDNIGHCNIQAFVPSSSQIYVLSAGIYNENWNACDFEHSIVYDPIYSNNDWEVTLEESSSDNIDPCSAYQFDVTIEAPNDIQYFPTITVVSTSSDGFIEYNTYQMIET